jgi:hypothetical protein
MTTDARTIRATGACTQDVGPWRGNKQGLRRSGQASLIYRGNGLRANQALMQWGRDTGTLFEPIDAEQSESYVSRYEAYLTDYRVEPRKLLWDVKLSIKIAG